MLNMKKWFLIRCFDVKKFFIDQRVRRKMESGKRKAEKTGFSFPDNTNKYIMCIAINSIIIDNIVNI